MFTLKSTCPESRARRGTLELAHGKVETPIFMPVGTQGTVKSVHPSELVDLGAQIILGNTYHLNLRPGTEVIKEFGGLHGFSTWDRPILTDSGGYQVFSLGSLNKITPEGVHFKSHLDGSALFIGPEESMQIQSDLGSDIAMLFDECPPYPCERKYAEESLHLTLAWAKRCRTFIDQNKPSASDKAAGTQHHFGIVQGSVYADLRERCARELTDMDFSGYAIGGVSVGEPEDEMMKAVEHSIPFLPETKPRYAMGLGTPPQILEMISKGVDMFDCVLPTRLARHGTALTSDGPLNLKNAKFRHDQAPLSETTAPSCQRFSRAYIHHLIRAKEILGMRILTLHNLAFYLDLVAQAREHIESGTFQEYRSAFSDRYLAHAK